jgi:hypothetical protein
VRRTRGENYNLEESIHKMETTQESTSPIRGDSPSNNRSGSPPLSDKHRHLLETESAIAPEIIAQRGYYTATRPAEVPEGFSAKQRRRMGLVIPLYSPDGETVSYQLRPNYPGKSGPKYLNPTGSSLIADAHPMMRGKLFDVNEPLLFTEGVRTGDAATSQGFCTVVLPGVWNIAEPKTEGRELHSCLRNVPLKGRLVRIVFDADAMINSDVQKALVRGVSLLERQGAIVRVAYPPMVNGDPKTGLDDYLAAGGDLDELLQSAKPFEPVDIRKERLSRDERLRNGLADLWATWEAMPATSRGHCTDRSIRRALIEIAAEHGKVRVEGLEVRPSVRTLAVSAGVSPETASNSLQRQENAGGVRKVPGKRKLEEAQAYILPCNMSTPGGASYVDTKERGTQGEESQEQQRKGGNTTESLTYAESYPGVNSARGGGEEVPELRPTKVAHRWERVESPTGGKGRWRVVDTDVIARLGKKRGEIIRYLVWASGSASIEEVMERFAGPKTRVRDFKRDCLAELQGFRKQKTKRWIKVEEDTWKEVDLDRVDLGPPIIEIDGDTLRLTPEWRENLEIRRTIGEEQEDEKLQANKIARQRERFHKVRKEENGENVADKTPEPPKPEKVREIIAKGREDDAASRLREQREKAGLPVEDFIRDRLVVLGSIRLELLEQVWRDRGGNPAHVYPTARLMGCELVARQELQGEVFVYPPVEMKREPEPEPETLPDNLAYLFPEAAGSTSPGRWAPAVGG